MTYRIDLRFTAPVHLGFMDAAYEVSESLIHSDTIFSALVCSHALLYGREETNKLFEALVSGRTHLLVSSAFHRINGVRFLPRPKGETFGLDRKLDVSRLKTIKKIKFVDEEIILHDLRVDEKDICGQYLSKKVELLGSHPQPFVILERARVSVGRLNSSSNLFYFAEVHFAQNCGLWFYLSVDESIEKRIFAALKLLSEEGFGGDRTYGLGSFEYEVSRVELPKEGEKYLLTSICVPSEEDLKNFSETFLSYELTTRTGYIYGTDKRSKKVWALTEGSVFSRPINGSLLDVTPEGFESDYGYRVYRFGKAFLLPFKGGDRG